MTPGIRIHLLKAKAIKKCNTSTIDDGDISSSIEVINPELKWD